MLITYIDTEGEQRANVIQDQDGNDLQTFIQNPVKNITGKGSVLTLESAEAEDQSITLSFNEPLRDSRPAPARFKITANGKPRAVLAVESSPADGSLTLQLRDAILPQQQVRLSYSDPAGNQNSRVVEDAKGVDLQAIKNFEVVNRSSDNNPPALQSASLQGRKLILEFDELLDGGLIASSRFKLNVDGRIRPLSDDPFKASDTQAVHLLSEPLPASARQVSLSYSDPRSDQNTGVLQDLFGNDVANFRSVAVDLI